MREVKVTRKTKETEIEVELIIDGSGKCNISTGIGFFDHMLESFAKHSGIDLSLKAIGDLHIDMHHTVEDTGIVLGKAVKEALGDFAGLVRFGNFYAPLDEALSRAIIDVSNRPFLVWNVEFVRDKVGQMDTELFREFFAAFAGNAGICIHIENLYGTNTHHIIESCFKALARAFKAAIAIDVSLNGQAASTKGVL